MKADEAATCVGRCWWAQHPEMEQFGRPPSANASAVYDTRLNQVQHGFEGRQASILVHVKV